MTDNNQSVVCDLSDLLSDLKQKSGDQDKTVIAEVEKLAQVYLEAEAKTMSTVREVEKYSKNLVEAADDFMKNGDVDALRKDVMDTERIKDSLKESAEKHLIIQRQISFIESTATKAVTAADKEFESEIEWRFATLNSFNKHVVEGGAMAMIVVYLGGTLYVDYKEWKKKIKKFRRVAEHMEPVSQHLEKVTSV